MELGPERLKQLLDSGEAQLIDVRTPKEVAAARIPGSRHVELTQLRDAAGSIDPERPVVFYCRSGDRSSFPTQAFAAAGYEAYNLTGGILAWRALGLPVEGGAAPG